MTSSQQATATTKYTLQIHLHITNAAMNLYLFLEAVLPHLSKGLHFFRKLD